MADDKTHEAAQVDGMLGSAESDAPPWSRVLSDPNLKEPTSQGAGGRQSADEDLDSSIGWDRFEKLLLSVGQNIHGLHGVKFRRYGTPGQAQHGIDLAGIRPDGGYTVIQCKEYQNFTASDLSAAVEKFVTGRKPFDADEFVVAVSSRTGTTQLEDELAALRKEHPDLTIELYGAEQINELLRNRADIVARFWSHETAASFCTGAPIIGVPAPLPDRSAQADRILAGPLVAMGLGPTHARADQARADAPEEAAGLYAALAERLDRDGFTGHAYVLRRKQVDTLREASLVAEAAAGAAALAAIGLHQGDSHNPWMLSHLLDELAKEEGAAAETRRHAQLIAAAESMTTHPLGATDHLWTALKAEDQTPVGAYVSLLVLLLGETMLLDNATALPELDDMLLRAITQFTASPVAGVSDHVLVRLRLVRAEYDLKERAALAQAARRHELIKPEAALVNARMARWAVVDGLPEEAIESWRNAVSDGIHAGLVDDAADWLYAIRGANVLYGPWTDAMNDEHLLAQALRATGSGALLSRVRSPREHMLSELSSERPREAILAARRYLVDCIVTGKFAGEHESREILADLYWANAEPALAAHYYETAHETDKLKKLVAALGDVPLDVGPLRDATWWVLESRAIVLAEQVDLLDDDAAAERLPELIALAMRTRAGEVSDGSIGSLTTQAARSVGALAARGSEQDAQAVLDLFASDVSRPPNHYKFTDGAHSRACVEIIRTHPGMKRLALERLLDLAEADVHEALELLSTSSVLELLGLPIKRSRDDESVAAPHEPAEPALDRAPFVSRIAALAASGRYHARITLCALQPEHADVVEHAHAARERLMTRPEPDPNQVSLGTTMIADAYLVSLLDASEQLPVLHKVMGVASDAREAAANRQDALRSARNLVLDQPAKVRKGVFLQAKAFATGEQDGSFLDEMTGTPHPLSTFKVSMGTSSLRGFGLELAWASASDDEDRVWVRDQAISLLQSADEFNLNQVAHMLSNLPNRVTTSLDANLLSTHPDRSIRQLAAVLCTREPLRFRSVAVRLASDPDVGVRRVLAEGLEQAEVGDLECAVSLRAILSRDVRHSVRQVANRTKS